MLTRNRDVYVLNFTGNQMHQYNNNNKKIEINVKNINKNTNLLKMKGESADNSSLFQNCSKKTL